MTYTTTKVKFEILEKKLNRLFKKIAAVGGNYTFNVIRTFDKEVPVYAVDELTMTQHEIGTMFVECVEFELDFDEYVCGNYRFGAVVEATDEENLVYALHGTDTTEFNQYHNCKLTCEHCNTNRARKKVIILVERETGAHKMVGKACAKDYTGYDVETFASYIQEIREILLNGDELSMTIRDTDRNLYQAVNVRRYLAHCIKIICTNGYDKETTKYEAFEKHLVRDIEDEYLAKADTVIEFFKNMTIELTTPSFYIDTRLYVIGAAKVKYPNGFIAYAYVLMNKIIEKQTEKERQNTLSNYVGNIGDKINIKGTVTITGYYTTEYGIVNIYKITDENGNVFIWKTTAGFKFKGTTIDTDTIDTIELTATVKDHNEYNGQKQTIITRAKVTAYIAK